MNENISPEIFPRMKYGMTPAQSLTLKFIKEYIGEKGYAPSCEEIKCNLGLKSKSGVHRMLLALQERGLVDFLPNRSRSLIIRE